MRRFHRLAAVLPAIVLGAALAAPAAAAPRACAGSGWVAPDFSTFEQRTAGSTTTVTFEFYGMHPLCLADGSMVDGEVTGRLWQTSGPNGIWLAFDETLTYAGGTLGYSGDASLVRGRWQSSVRTTGMGTGILAGITGQGTFSPIDPTTGAFTDEIFYNYR